ncbi:unnamed protein product [Heterobilharzia americana]|nr:unnamed protein product [Heterobilharzia americana]
MIPVVKLLDCFDDSSVSEFVLKVSKFPEIALLPSFHQNFPVHFVAQSVICQNNNFRLSVKLATANVTATSNTLSPNSISSIKKSQSISSSEKIYISSQKPFINQPKVQEIKPTPNTSSAEYVGRELTNTRSTDWVEYRFLLLPAILAFFTLIGMQIVLCSFWLPNSITDKIFAFFGKCRYKKESKLRTNHEIIHKDEIKNGDNMDQILKIYSSEDFMVTAQPQQYSCWSVLTSESVHSNKDQMSKQSYSSTDCLMVPKKITGSCVLTNHYSQSRCHDHQSQRETKSPPKDLAENSGEPIILHEATAICNCIIHADTDKIFNNPRNMSNLLN